MFPTLSKIKKKSFQFDCCFWAPKCWWRHGLQTWIFTGYYPWCRKALVPDVASLLWTIVSHDAHRLTPVYSSAAHWPISVVLKHTMSQYISMSEHWSIIVWQHLNMCFMWSQCPWQCPLPECTIWSTVLWRNASYRFQVPGSGAR